MKRRYSCQSYSRTLGRFIEIGLHEYPGPADNWARRVNYETNFWTRVIDNQTGSVHSEYYPRRTQ